MKIPNKQQTELVQTFYSSDNKAPKYLRVAATDGKKAAEEMRQIKKKYEN